MSPLIRMIEKEGSRLTEAAVAGLLPPGWGPLGFLFSVFGQSCGNNFVNTFFLLFSEQRAPRFLNNEHFAEKSQSKNYFLSSLPYSELVDGLVD